MEPTQPGPFRKGKIQELTPWKMMFLSQVSWFSIIHVHIIYLKVYV